MATRYPSPTEVSASTSASTSPSSSTSPTSLTSPTSTLTVAVEVEKSKNPRKPIATVQPIPRPLPSTNPFEVPSPPVYRRPLRQRRLSLPEPLNITLEGVEWNQRLLPINVVPPSSPRVPTPQFDDSPFPSWPNTPNPSPRNSPFALPLPDLSRPNSPPRRNPNSPSAWTTGDRPTTPEFFNWLDRVFEEYPHWDRNRPL